MTTYAITAAALWSLGLVCLLGGAILGYFASEWMKVR